MEYVIAKEFKTLIHRFKVGDAVAESYNLQPFTFTELKERGVVVEKTTAQTVWSKPSATAARDLTTKTVADSHRVAGGN